MKKSVYYIMTVCLLLSVCPIQTNASTSDNVLVTPIATTTETLQLRLNEINEIDKSKLNSSEKRELRTEVRAIKQQLEETSVRGGGGGVYLSLGAIIIITLLLIILL